MKFFTLCRLVLCLLWLLPLSASAQVVLSEVGWAGSDLSTADEWFELTLADPAAPAQSLSGWTLYSGADTEPMIRFGPLSVSGAIVVANYSETQSRLLAAPALVTTAVSLPNVGLRLELRRADGSVADTVVLGDHPAGRTGAGGNGWASAERLDLLRSGSDPANWRTAESAAGFDPGAPLFGTPGFAFPSMNTTSGSSSSFVSTSSSTSTSSASGSGDVLDGAALVLSSSSSSVSSSSLASSSSSTSASAAHSSSSVSTRAIPLVGRLRITEVMADPEGNDDGEWVEVANLSAETIDIAGVLLQRRGFSRSYRFVELFGSGASLEPDEHLLIPRTQSLITLPNAGGEVFLTDGEELIDSFVYPAATEGVSSGLLEGLITFFCAPTPGTPNTRILPSGSLIVQGGALSGVGRVSLNVAADLPDLPGDISCHINFGDGSAADSCNPSTHVFSSVGSYDVSLTALTACGTVEASPLVVSVLEQPAAIVLAANVSGSKTTLSSSSSGAGQRSCSPSAATGVSIAGALPNPALDDEEGEQILLKNKTKQPIDLCGWVLDDGAEGSKPFRLDGTVLSAAEVKILPRPQTGIALNNDGDSVRLFRPGDERPYSEFTYDKAAEDQMVGPDFPAFVSSSSSKTSHEESMEPYLERKNHYIQVSVPQGSDAAEGDVFMSEVLSHPAKGETEWIELENESARSVDLSGWVLDDDPNGGSTAWVMPQGTVLEAGELRVFTRAETKLSLNDGGDIVELRRGSQVMDAVDLPALKSGIAYALMADGEWCQTTSLTPGDENTCYIKDDVQPKSKTKKSKISTADPSGSGEDLLAALQSGGRRGEMGQKPQSGASYGWLVWTLAVIGSLGAVAWVWMHFDEWRWKLQEKAK